MARPVVLIHGAWHGAWCWERVTPHLDRAGIAWAAPDLPSCADAASGKDLSSDLAAVEAALDALPGSEPAVLCGHSRGGLVLTEIGSHPRAGHLVYLAALLLAEGETTTDVMGDSKLFTILTRNEDKTFLPQPGPGAGIFYNDCSGEDVAWAMANVRSQNLAGKGPSPSGESWRTTPSTYVVCALDQAIPAESQRRIAARTGTVLEWDTGHSPFINRPELVASLLIGLANA